MLDASNLAPSWLLVISIPPLTPLNTTCGSTKHRSQEFGNSWQLFWNSSYERLTGVAQGSQCCATLCNPWQLSEENTDVANRCFLNIEIKLTITFRYYRCFPLISVKRPPWSCSRRVERHRRRSKETRARWWWPCSRGLLVLFSMRIPAPSTYYRLALTWPDIRLGGFARSAIA